jgi:hypothetical protein
MCECCDQSWEESPCKCPCYNAYINEDGTCKECNNHKVHDRKGC